MHSKCPQGGKRGQWQQEGNTSSYTEDANYCTWFDQCSGCDKYFDGKAKLSNANKGICSEGIRKGKKAENVRYREKRSKNVVIHRIFFLFQEEFKKNNE